MRRYKSLGQWSIQGGCRDTTERAIVMALAKHWYAVRKFTQNSLVLFNQETGSVYAELDFERQQWRILGELPGKTLENAAKKLRSLILDWEEVSVDTTRFRVFVTAGLLRQETRRHFNLAS